MVISLGQLSPATSRGLPAAQTTRAGSRCLLGLAPTGGYRATPVARRAVGSYPTVSPLPLDKRAVCSLWPFPSPRGAQELPGSLPCGARTFLGTPLQPTCRDHHALPPPDTKATGSGRVGARLARQPPQQAAQAVERDALPEPGCLVRGDPKPGVPQGRDTGPGRQRVKLRPIAEAGDPAAPRGVAELLAHRVAAWALDVQAEGDDQSTLLRGQAAEGGVRAGESLGPQCRIERA